jgi:hypothetical protein
MLLFKDIKSILDLSQKLPPGNFVFAQIDGDPCISINISVVVMSCNPSLGANEVRDVY